MDRNDVNWAGPMVALVTPFRADGSFDAESLARHVDFVIGQGIAGIVPNGCTGEFWAQTREERREVVGATVKAARGRVPVIGGATASGTREVIQLMGDCKDVGCDGVMLMPPYMVKPNRDDMLNHYKVVSEAVDIPILLYNNPSDSGADLTPDMVARLADLRTVVAIKDSTFDYNIFWKLQTTVADRIRILIGPSTMFGAAAIHMGADGWVDTYSNVWPELTVGLYRAAREGRVEEARAIQKTAAEFRSFMLQPGWNMYCAIKAAMALIGLPGGEPRLPLRPLPPAEVERLDAGLRRFGVPRITENGRVAAA